MPWRRPWRSSSATRACCSGSGGRGWRARSWLVLSGRPAGRGDGEVGEVVRVAGPEAGVAAVAESLEGFGAAGAAEGDEGGVEPRHGHEVGRGLLLEHEHEVGDLGVEAGCDIAVLRFLDVVAEVVAGGGEPVRVAVRGGL